MVIRIRELEGMGVWTVKLKGKNSEGVSAFWGYGVLAKSQSRAIDLALEKAKAEGYSEIEYRDSDFVDGLLFDIRHLRNYLSRRQRK
jgi:hypothetical protein